MTPTRLAAGQDNSAPVTTTTPAAPTTTTKSGKARKRKTTRTAAGAHRRWPPIQTTATRRQRSLGTTSGCRSTTRGTSQTTTRTASRDRQLRHRLRGTGRARFYTGSYPRAYVMRDTADQPHRSYVMTLVESYGGETETASGQYLHRAGNHLDRPRRSSTARIGPHGRSARRSISTARLGRSASSPGTRSATSTGSPTRCRTRCRPTRWSRWPSRSRAPRGERARR